MKAWSIPWLLALGYGSAMGQTWQHALTDSNQLPTTPGGGGSFTSGERGPSGTLLVGSDLCGLFRSTDDGESWQCQGDRAGILQTHILTVSCDPRPGTTLALAAADAASGEPTHQIAIFRSTDDGQSWSAAYSSAERVAKSAYITAFAWRADTVLATGTNGASGDSIRMWRSLDAGAAWALQAAPTGLPIGTRPLKLATRGPDASHLWLLTGRDAIRPSGYAALYSSPDGGATWTESAGPAASGLAPTGPALDFACDPSRPETLLVTVGEGSRDDAGRVFKSTDGGLSWNPKSPAGCFTGCIAWLPSRIVIVNVSRNLIDASWAGTWESPDAEDDWIQRSNGSNWGTGWEPGLSDDLDWAFGKGRFGLARTLGRDLAGDQLYWIASRSVSRSTDQGLTFEHVHTTLDPGTHSSYTRGLEDVVPFAGLVPDEDGDRLFAGYYDLGLWRMAKTDPEHAGYWAMCNPPAWSGPNLDQWRGHGGNCSVVLPDSATSPYPPSPWVWAALGPTKGHQNFMRSPANGDPGTWQEVAGLPGAAFIHGLSVAPKLGLGDKTLYVTADGDVYKSIDHGATWVLQAGGSGFRVTAVDRTDSSLVYAGGERGLFRSTNGGETWTKIGEPEFEAPSYPAESTTVFAAQWKGIHGIATDPNGPGKVWVAAHGPGRGVWVSSDRGDTWTKLRTGDAYRSVAVSPVRSDWVWVTAGDQSTGGRAVPSPPGPSVEHTQDGGKTWIDDRGNLVWPFAWQIYVDGRHRVYLGAPGMGFYWADFGGEPAATPNPCLTVPRGPNPARVGTLPAGLWFDISGRRISEPRGPGVYFYRGGSCGRHIVVLK